MKISIINPDNTVVVDGVCFDSLDLSLVPSTVHAIQFDTATSSGHIEYRGGALNEEITSIAAYQYIIDAHTTLNGAQSLPVEATAQEILNNESLAYLASTDWLIVRQAETGVAIPADITTARAAARLAIIYEAPIPMPINDNRYSWNETTLTWDIVE